MNTKVNYLSAAGLINTFRASDYTFNTAVLEITDNPLDKKATDILVHIFGKGNPSIVDRLEVLDNGSGMTNATLQKAFVIGNSQTNRGKTDIGMYHVGLKFGSMNMGDVTHIVSKSPDGQIVGLTADYAQMIAMDVFEPVLFSDGTQLKEHFDEANWKTFIEQKSGTLISIGNILSKHRAHSERLFMDLSNQLRLAYIGLDPHTSIKLRLEGKPDTEVTPLDPFYTHEKHKNKHQRPAVKTTLLVFKNETHVERPYRVIEKCTHSRTTFTKANRDLKELNGTPEKPVYIEYMVSEHAPTNWSPQVIKKLKHVDLPPSSTLIGEIHLETIFIKGEQYNLEPNDMKGVINSVDRKGFWFQRGVRFCAAAQKLGIFMNMELERMRMNIKFDPVLDSEMGVKYTKQNSASIPCKPIENAITSIWRQITGAWVSVTKEQRAQEKEVPAKPKAANKNVPATNAVQPSPAKPITSLLGQGQAQQQQVQKRQQVQQQQQEQQQQQQQSQEQELQAPAEKSQEQQQQSQEQELQAPVAQQQEQQQEQSQAQKIQDQALLELILSKAESEQEASVEQTNEGQQNALLELIMKEEDSLAELQAAALQAAAQQATESNTIETPSPASSVAPEPNVHIGLEGESVHINIDSQDIYLDGYGEQVALQSYLKARLHLNGQQQFAAFIREFSELAAI